MTRRQIRENLYKMLFQVEFHDKESLRTQIEIYLEDLEMADEKDKRELRDKFNELVENLEDIDAKIEEKANGWTINSEFMNCFTLRMFQTRLRSTRR